jgi:cytochrome c biogenesis protein ResB
MMKNGPPVASSGVALSFDFRPLPDEKTMDRKNIPTAIIELAGANGALGTWVASDWTGDEALIGAVQASYAQQMGAGMAEKISGALAVPQTVELADKKFSFVLRPTRVRHPFALTLLKATHTVYAGTVTDASPDGIPKDFRSRVRLENSQTGENREVEISMNHPLRYGGLTFYQYQMSAGEMVDRAGQTPSSVLQVVRNPAWLTPYIGCGMVAAGLVTQFLFHLVGFISKRKSK